MPTYRIIDLRPAAEEGNEGFVQAKTPELAARELLGLELYRSGNQKDLVARVYWSLDGQPTNMVRLYSKAANPRLAAVNPPLVSR